MAFEKLKKIKDVFLIKDGNKKVLNPKIIKRLSMAFGLIGIIALLVGEPRKTIQKKVFSISQADISSKSRMSIPRQSDLPKHSPIKSKTDRGQKLSGPSLLIRPGAEKIVPGTIVKAVLKTAATDGPVKVNLLEDVICDGDIKIPVGAELIGQGQSLSSRVGIKFTHAIIHGRDVMEIKANALDFVDQLVGLSASKVDSETIKLGASVGLNFVGGVAEGMKEKTGVNGAVVEKNSVSNALLNGAAQASLDQARSMMEEIKNTKEPLVVPVETKILVFFEGGH